MNAPATPEITTILGTALAGGFYAGRIRQDDGRIYALFVAPKAEGEHAPAIWIPDYQAVPGAQSYNDGLANTQAMAAAGSQLAQWALGLSIGGCNDWYLPSQDELEIIYRNLKPTEDENSGWYRSGMNPSAVEPTRPYLPTAPLQTPASLFQAGAAEAFEADWYWTSTQHAANSDCAWYQHFDDGNQDDYCTSLKLRARAVRRLPI